MKWLLAVVAIVVLGWLGYTFLGDKGAEEAGEAVQKAAEVTQEVTQEAIETAQEAMPAGVDVSKIKGGLEDLFGSTTEALSGITDVDSATAAIPAIEGATSKLSGISDLIARLPDAAKAPLQTVVANGMVSLQPLIDKVTAMPGVGPVIEPIVKPMLEMLEGLSG